MTTTTTKHTIHKAAVWSKEANKNITQLKAQQYFIFGDFAAY